MMSMSRKLLLTYNYYRLHPIAFAVSRITQENMVLCGFEVPSGVSHLSYIYFFDEMESLFMFILNVVD